MAVTPTVLPLFAGSVPDAGWVEATRASSDAVAAARLGFALGTSAPPVVLADDRVCDPLSSVAPLTPRAQAVDAFAGKGPVPAAPVLADWQRSAGTLPCSGYLRERLRAVAPGLLPAEGALLAVVNLEAVHRLERSVHAGSRASAARRRGLIELAVQRALVVTLLGATSATVPAHHRLIASAHADLLRGHPRRSALRRLLLWLDALGVDSGALPMRSEGPVWLDALRDPDEAGAWGDLVRRVRRAGFRVFQLDQEPPEPERPPMPPDARLLHRLRSAEVGHEQLETDRLGVYASAGATLPPGVHLFCDRIDAVASFTPEERDVLPWGVLWHELAHWRLDDLGARPSPARLLHCVDVAEVYCEIEAHRGAEAGRTAWLDPAHWPARSSRPLRRWRESARLLPYSWYPRLLLLRETVTPDEWERFVVGMNEHLRRAEESLAALSEPDAEAEGQADAWVALLAGEMPFEAGRRFVLEGARATSPKRRLLARPVVYLWRGT